MIIFRAFLRGIAYFKVLFHLKSLPIFEDFHCFTLFIRIYASKQVLHISAYCRNFAPQMKIRQIKTTSDDLRIYNLYE